MRVAHLLPYMHLGGTERVILNLCRFGIEEQWVVATMDGPMRPVFEAHGVRVAIGEDREALAGALSGADVVNVHWLSFDAYLFAAAAAARRPMVCTLHGASALPRMPGPVICVAQHVYDLQEENREWRRLIRNGVDTTRFRPIDRGPGRARILRVCRPARCADYFWPALWRVLERCPEAELTVVGGPAFRTGRAEGLGARSDVERIFGEADLFAYAPQWWEGGMDLVVLEAMASGLPCALPDVRCVNQAVEHAVTGLLSPFEDVAAFAADVERLVRDRELRRELGERAAQVARERFDVRDRAPLYTAAYREAVRDGCVPARAHGG
jgi:glycosyltransferase involved in cell wall biosynthesis